MSKTLLLKASVGLLTLTGLNINLMATIPTATAEVKPNQKVYLAQTKPLVVVFPNRGEATEARRKADAIAQFLSRELKMPVQAVVSDETAAVEALRANRADVAFLSSRPALKAEQLADSKLYLAEVRPNYSGGHSYKSVLVVKKNSPLRNYGNSRQTLAQLKGKRMAFASRTSGSGFIIPTGELVSKGFVSSPDRYGDFFRQVFYGDGYTSALQAVLRGQADVAAVSEYALATPYLKPEEASQLRVLHSIPGVPAHGVSIDDDVPPFMRNQIINALLKLNQSGNNQLLRDLSNATQLVRINHSSHLGLMRQALKKANMEP
jgi:phosphonate transport system substrate-binding protein